MPWKNLLITGGLLLITQPVIATSPSHEITDGPHAVRRMPLGEEALLITAENRQLLGYLIQCALPADVELYSDVDGVRHVFRGAMGLAPAWAERALTETEQRWVSACIMARTNYFGKKISISMRAQQTEHAALTASAREQEDYTVFEGGYFGNVFATQPVAYTCSGNHGRLAQDNSNLVDRVCTIPTSNKTAEGLRLSRCNFIHVGRCNGVERFTIDGVTYDEVIFTYLKPVDTVQEIRGR